MSKRIFTLFFMLVLVSAGFAQKKEVNIIGYNRIKKKSDFS